jgi:hypothetical protein
MSKHSKETSSDGSVVAKFRRFMGGTALSAFVSFQVGLMESDLFRDAGETGVATGFLVGTAAGEAWRWSGANLHSVRKVAMITGAVAGTAAAVARQLARQNVNLDFSGQTLAGIGIVTAVNALPATIGSTIATRVFTEGATPPAAPPAPEISA